MAAPHQAAGLAWTKPWLLEATLGTRVLLGDSHPRALHPSRLLPCCQLAAPVRLGVVSAHNTNCANTAQNQCLLAAGSAASFLPPRKV